VAEKKEEIKAFNPTDQATLDAHETDFFGGRHFRIEKLGVISQRRGLVGSQIWTPRALSSPLRLFAKESRDMEEDKVDLLLNGLAAALGVDPHATKRQFYAVRQNWEDQFLSDLDKEEQKRKKLEALAEEAESTPSGEEPTETEED
jgi:hypothetical protein